MAFVVQTISRGVVSDESIFDSVDSPRNRDKFSSHSLK